MAKCETTVESEPILQAPESNKASGADDSSAKTIEFLRARLLSERAASKAARQQAQEIAEKVKELNVRLEMETKSRKEAESAMGKVFTILKAKGLALDALASSTDPTDQPEKGVGELDDVKEMNEDPQGFSSRTENSSIDKEVSPKPVQANNESAEKGAIEEKKFIQKESYASDVESGIGIVSEVDQTLGTHCNMCKEASPQQAVAVADKPMVYADDTSVRCPPNVKQYSQTAESFDERPSITVKLKAMLHQMEVEMAALPKEQQPLKLQLQTWVDHVSGVLDKEQGAGLNADRNGDVNASSNHLSNEVKKVNVVAIDKIPAIPGGYDDMKGEMNKILSIATSDMPQQSNVMPPLSNYERPSPSTHNNPALPSKVLHSRRSSYDALYFSQQPPNLPVPLQFGGSQPSRAPGPLFANGYAANGPPCYVEAQSPRSLNSFSLVNGTSMVDYRHKQSCGTRFQGRGVGIERQDGYEEDALKRRSRMWSQAGHGSDDMFSRPFIVDVSDNVHMKQDECLNTQNIHLQRGCLYSHRMDQAKKSAESNMVSLTNERNGRLGDILMVLDAARQHVSGKEQSHYMEERLLGPPEEARLNRGGPYGDDVQQMPYEHISYARRSWAHKQAPIVQFPPSPASEHGYSPFERHGQHRRSSSVSANFQMSRWDGYLQPRGEVQLGNGITLYTD